MSANSTEPKQSRGHRGKPAASHAKARRKPVKTETSKRTDYIALSETAAVLAKFDELNSEICELVELLEAMNGGENRQTNIKSPGVWPSTTPGTEPGICPSTTPRTAPGEFGKEQTWPCPSVTPGEFGKEQTWPCLSVTPWPTWQHYWLYPGQFGF